MSLINNMLRDLDRRRAAMPADRSLAAQPTTTVAAASGKRTVFGLLVLLVLAGTAYEITVTAVPPTVEPRPQPTPQPPILPSLHFSGGQEALPPLPPPEALPLRESRQLTIKPEEPTPPAVMTEVGDMVRTGQGQQAEKLLRRSLRRDATDQHSRLLLSRLLWERDRQEEAVTLLTTALPHAQGSEMARLLAHFRLQQKRPQEALAVLEQASARLGWQQRLRVEQDPELASFVAAMHQQLGDHRQSIEWYNALLRDDPKESNHWLAMAISLEAITARSEAKQAFRQALDTGRLTPVLEEYARSRLK